MERCLTGSYRSIAPLVSRRMRCHAKEQTPGTVGTSDEQMRSRARSKWSRQRSKEACCSACSPSPQCDEIEVAVARCTMAHLAHISWVGYMPTWTNRVMIHHEAHAKADVDLTATLNPHLIILAQV